jgi:hypothetical protein
MTQNIFKEFNKQYYQEIKYGLNQFLYRIIHVIKHKGKKRLIEKKKLIILGEITSINFLISDLSNDD